MLKKFYGFTMAIALLASLGVLGAGPAVAAGGTSCKPPSGKITLSPGLSSTAKVQTIVINLPVAGCTGGGVTGGTFKGTLKTAALTAAQFATSTTPLKFTASITWNNKKTSTFSATATTKIGKTITDTIKGKVTKGLFLGSSVTSTQTVTPGPTVGGVIKFVTIKGTANFVIK